MTVAIGTYIRLLNENGTDSGYRFQNFFMGETRSYAGVDYMPAAFGFSGGALDIQAANITANLVFSLNELGLSIFTQAVNERWLIQLRTVWLDPDTLDETNTFSEEIYAITGMEHDTSRLSVRLGSPLDAVKENAPKRTLSAALVGALPTTGEISLS